VSPKRSGRRAMSNQLPTRDEIHKKPGSKTLPSKVATVLAARSGIQLIHRSLSPLTPRGVRRPLCDSVCLRSLSARVRIEEVAIPDRLRDGQPSLSCCRRYLGDALGAMVWYS